MLTCIIVWNNNWHPPDYYRLIKFQVININKVMQTLFFHKSHIHQLYLYKNLDMIVLYLACVSMYTTF